MTQDLKTPHPRTSGPTAAAKRFVAQVMDYTLREGWRTPDDFLRFFPPEVIMESLKNAPELRVAILSRATGMHEQILQRKSLRLAAEDLRLSLSEGVSNGFQLLEAFPAQDRIRYLDTQRLWDFLIEDQFWRLDELNVDPELLRSSAARMAFTLSTALKEKLLTLRDVLEAITYESVADSLAPDELRSVVRYALLKGRDGIALNEKTLLEVLPLEKLLGTVPLEHTWNEVVTKRVAIPNNLTDLRREERRASQSRSRPPSREVVRRPSQRPPPSSVPNTAAYLPPVGPLASAVSGAMSGVALPAPPLAPAPPLPMLQREPLLETPRQPMVAQNVVAQNVVPHNFVAPPVMAHNDAEQQQRQRVSEHLRSIGRLPLAHERLPLAVLRSIDAMYSLLPSATDDIQRKSVIRAAFSGDHHLRMALLGLIELMDSSIDTTDPVIQEAKIDALIKILLFEEQRRKETGRMYAPGSFPGRGAPEPHTTTTVGIGGPMPSRYATPPPGSYPTNGSYPPGRPLAASYRDSSPPGPMSDLGSRPPPPGGRRRTVPPPLPPAFGSDVPGPDRGLS